MAPTAEGEEAAAAAKRQRRARRRGEPAEGGAGGEAGEPEEGEGPLPADLEARILRQAREQQRELAEESLQKQRGGAAGAARQEALASALRGLGPEELSDGEEDDLSEPESEYLEEVEVDEEDERAVAAFLAPQGEGAQQKTLADIIMEKFRERQEAMGVGPSALGEAEAGAPEVEQGMDPKVVQVYKKVGEVLSRYKAGKIPKAFKVIPYLQNWEDVIFLTEPENWTPHATFQAVKVFASNLNQKLAQRFYSLVLLPKVREHILENRGLHFALFQALKKALFKSAAFYKGVLLPLCASGTCSVREAVIFSSVLKRVAIPALHSAAAMLRLAEMAYHGTNSFFIRVLLDKKYALPYKVIDSLVTHFLGFENEERTLPVVWHQCLLCFVQRYKSDIRREDKRLLRKLVGRRGHYLVGPEVLRELDHGPSRGERAPVAPGAPGGLTAASVGSRPLVENPKEFPPVVIMDED